MKVSTIEEDQINADIVDQVLYEGLDYKNQMADCALVLGSSSAVKYRVPTVVALYKDNRIKHIVMSGGRRLDTSNTEAMTMKNEAIRLGVHDQALILEETSLTTKENILCSLLSLDRAFKLSKINRLLLVTTRYHMRRSLLMAQTYMPDWIEIVPCPADDTNTLRHNWHMTERGQERVINEVKKIISYIREGSISDFEIQV